MHKSGVRHPVILWISWRDAKVQVFCGGVLQLSSYHTMWHVCSTAEHNGLHQDIVLQAVCIVSRFLSWNALACDDCVSICRWLSLRWLHILKSLPLVQRTASALSFSLSSLLLVAPLTGHHPSVLMVFQLSVTHCWQVATKLVTTLITDSFISPTEWCASFSTWICMPGFTASVTPDAGPAILLPIHPTDWNWLTVTNTYSDRLYNSYI